MFVGVNKSNIVIEYGVTPEEIRAGLTVVEVEDEAFQDKDPTKYKVFDNGRMITPRWEY